MKNKFISFSLILFSSQLLAYPCYLTVVKDRCWGDYEVSVVVSDGKTNEVVATSTVEKGKFFTRQSFSCQPGQNLAYKATFSPTIWAGEEGFVYKGKHFLYMPEVLPDKQKAWDIPICFPGNFSQTPYPPSASGKCGCQMKDVPPIPPQ